MTNTAQRIAISSIYLSFQGMTFLHSTDIKVHGNLKSSNCLVDSRWQLKLTDYGLPTFKSKQIKPHSCEHAKYRGMIHFIIISLVSVNGVAPKVILCFFLDMLWKAPELLRSAYSNGKGTQAADIYSFAIILQEFHTRKGPYSHNFDDIRGMCIFCSNI